MCRVWILIIQQVTVSLQQRTLVNVGHWVDITCVVVCSLFMSVDQLHCSTQLLIISHNAINYINTCVATTRIQMQLNKETAC